MAEDYGFTDQLTDWQSNDILAEGDNLKKVDITVKSGGNFKKGQPLAVQNLAVDTVVGAAVAGNTGNGVMTVADPAYATGVKEGVYKVIFVEPGADAGDFVVEDPDGVVIATGKVAVAFDDVIKFTIADGATDFVVGDSFTVTVALTTGATKYSAYDPTASDGLEVLTGILVEDVDASSADTPGAMYVSGTFNRTAIKARTSVTTLDSKDVYNYGAIVMKDDI